MEQTCPIHTKEDSEEDTENDSSESISSDSSYTIFTIVEGGGSISGPTQINAGDSATLTFTANEGYVLTNVTIDGVAQGAITTYTFDAVDADHSVVATFTATTNNGETTIPATSALRHKPITLAQRK